MGIGIVRAVGGASAWDVHDSSSDGQTALHGQRQVVGEPG